MWSCVAINRHAARFCRNSAVVLVPTAFLFLSIQQHTHDETKRVICEASDTTDQARIRRKQTTLQQASSGSWWGNKPFPQTTKRFNTKKELDEIRANEAEMLLRWERDEDGWRELPARAWPAYQPNPEQLKSIQVQVQEHGCTSQNATTTNDLCTDLLFNVATALVFYNVDPEAGLRQYEALANRGHVDSMVACGIVLVEGMGVPPNEQKGIEWLKKAVSLNSSQGCYELGTIFYTGIDGVLEEDSEVAFDLFQRAAEQDHPAGMYMMADCLLEGEGTEQNVGRAVPLFYRAAERGHRYSRQKIRELLAKYRVVE